MLENDYNLFGLNTETATIYQAKLAYYNLSLLVHPDRNISVSRNDACLEMCSLTHSYNNVKNDIEQRNRKYDITNCHDLKVYHQNIQKDLDDCVTNMPSFTEIFHETHEDMKNFNEIWFDKNDKTNTNDENPFVINLKNGYKICKSEYSYESDSNLEYTTELILDRDFNDFKYSKERSIVTVDHMNSNDTKCYSDYKEAFQPQICETFPLSVINQFSSNEKRNMIEEFEKKKQQYTETIEMKRRKDFMKKLKINEKI